MNFKEKHPGKLFVFSGPSGAGKGTICKKLLEENKELALSVSMTTRAPREGEVEGVSYYFTDRETFKKRIESLFGYVALGGFDILETEAFELFYKLFTRFHFEFLGNRADLHTVVLICCCHQV